LPLRWLDIVRRPFSPLSILKFDDDIPAGPRRTSQRSLGIDRRAYLDERDPVRQSTRPQSIAVTDSYVLSFCLRAMFFPFLSI